ncbi:hypothetical protein JL722_567 [Aureococcus anophagefferens]|nr:hypothetical protein JL722_567 [Aureococcus anophagefferens]
MAWQKTVYSSRGASIEGDEWDEPSFEDCALDEAVVIVDDGARYAAYEATWTVLPEEKRLDLQNHGRIGQSETGDGALQGLDDLCTLFDDGDGYDDASIDLGGNRLGTLGVEEVRSQLGLARFAECLRDRFGTRFGHALVHLDLSGNTLLGVGGHRMLGMKELVNGNARAFVGEDAADLSLAYRADPARKLLEGVRRNTSLLTLRLCRLEIDGVGPDPAALGAVGRSLVANACLPKLRANPFKWRLASAGDAKWELLRKFKYLDANEAKKLRSNATICADSDARTVLDAVAPPSCSGATAEKAGGRASVTDLATRKSNFWGKHVGPHRRGSQKQGVYPQRKNTVGPHRRESQRSGVYPGDDGHDPDAARDVHNALDPRATALARMADGEIGSRINVGTPPNDARGGG